MRKPCISPGSIVDQSVLQQSQEHEGDTDVVPHVDGLGVGHGGQGVVNGGGGGGHGEQRGDGERHPGGG